jgi:MFS family permease
MPSSRPTATKTSLAILALIMLVNALAYGIIIPLLYPYAERFGITPIGLSVMFASFSLAQFFATPILGRLSDRHGRKPWLVVSLFGTSVALALFALATNFWLLLVSRIVDGITGGNISIADGMTRIIVVSITDIADSSVTHHIFSSAA